MSRQFWRISAAFWMTVLMFSPNVMAMTRASTHAPFDAIPVIAVSEAHATFNRQGIISLTVSVRMAGTITVAAHYAIHGKRSRAYANPIREAVGQSLQSVPVEEEGEVQHEVLHVTLKPNSAAIRATRKRRVPVKIEITLRLPDGVSSGTGLRVTLPRILQR